MANIILPAVPVLNEIDDSAKLLIEQAGEINRYPISDLDIGGGDVTIDCLDDIKTYVNNQITNRVIHSGGKNLLKNTAKNLTKTGITFTINADSSVTLNGTATNDCYFTITSGVLLPSGNYILSGCPAGGSMDSYILYAAPAEGSNSIDIGNSVAFSTDGTQKYSFTICVTSGVTVTGLTYYPMLRIASEIDDTYEPYYEGLKEVSNKLSMELLWENASPTSEFAAQSVPIENDGYRFLMIKYKNYYTDNSSMSNIFAVGTSMSIAGFFYGDSDNRPLRFVMRNISNGTDTNTVTFGNSTFKDMDDKSPTVNNQNVIPTAIYGIK